VTDTLTLLIKVPATLVTCLTWATARIEPRTNGTQRTSRYCTCHPSGLATGLHGQAIWPNNANIYKAGLIVYRTTKSAVQLNWRCQKKDILDVLKLL